MFRKWTGRFSFAEWAVVTFVFDRTVGFGKIWERITLDHIEFGVWSELGECVIPGIGGTRTTIVKCIATLTGDKYKDDEGRTPLIRRDAEGKIYYALDFKYKVPERMLPIPKRLRQPAHSSESKLERFKNWTDNGSDSKPKVVQKAYSNRTKEKDKGNRTKITGEISGETLAEKVRFIRDRHVGIRKSKAQKAALNPGSSVDALNLLWRTVMIEEFPKVPALPWTVAERGMVAKLRKKWLGAGNTKSTFGLFLEWCIREWGPMMHYAFPSKSAHKMKAPPVPALPFLVKCVRLFIEKYHDGSIAAAVKKNSPQELARRERETAKLEERATKSRKLMEETNQGLQHLRKQRRLELHRRSQNVQKVDLGIEPKIANLDHLLEHYER